MKKLSLFELQHCSRKIVDDFMIENNYKILDILLTENVNTYTVRYKLQSIVLNTIDIMFKENKVFNIQFNVNK